MDMLETQKQCWQTAEEKGFHDDYDGIPNRKDVMLRLCLIHTEVSEAAQEVKRHFPEEGQALATHIGSVGEELADVIIRVFDIAESLSINMANYVEVKMIRNAMRPKNYGTAKEASDG